MNENIKILVIDDNEELCKMLKKFNEEIFDMDYIVNPNLVEDIDLNEYHLLILDLDLGDAYGIDVYEKLKMNYNGPVVFISGTSKASDRIKGLQLGAEDFIEKPFNLLEFQLKISNIINRSGNIDLLKIGEYTINERQHIIHYRDEEVELAPAPYRLLLYLLKNPNIILSRELILKNVWNYEVSLGDRIVDTNINLIRKITQDGNIKSIRGVGYKYELN